MMHYLAALLLAVLVACGASPPRVPTADETRGQPDVVVELGTDFDPSRIATFDEHDGRNRLRHAVLNELIRQGKGPSLAADRLVVTVTKFRLRSTASGVLGSSFAGADMLDVSGAIQKDGLTLRTAETGVGGLMAGFVKPTADGRFNGLVLEAAKRLVAEL
jgi:hypothetical protein